MYIYIYVHTLCTWYIYMWRSSRYSNSIYIYREDICMDEYVIIICMLGCGSEYNNCEVTCVSSTRDSICEWERRPTNDGRCKRSRRVELQTSQMFRKQNTQARLYSTLEAPKQGSWRSCRSQMMGATVTLVSMSQTHTFAVHLDVAEIPEWWF